MSKIRVVPIPTPQVRAYQRGAPDANHRPPERHKTGGGPCRHCLEPIAVDEEKLVLAYRPFEALQPYAEVGPIFLHARPCAAYDNQHEVPKMFEDWGESLVIVRGYGDDHRICYDTCKVVPANSLEDTCRELLQTPDVAYLHVRAAQTNCYQCRVERW
ncbi:DUF1203 domain-containing protein [Sedimenticola sp.]|uniref:DUF1203 domain-containing protein n=1 Tax=Sedimenticola sp. TaxID=1940285 RepID=UPI003D0AF480